MGPVWLPFLLMRFRDYDSIIRDFISIVSSAASSTLGAATILEHALTCDNQTGLINLLIETFIYFLCL